MLGGGFLVILQVAKRIANIRFTKEKNRQISLSALAIFSAKRTNK